MQDAALCQHVLAVHQTGRAPERSEGQELLDAATLRAYIAKAKQYNPFIPEELTGSPQECTKIWHANPIGLLSGMPVIWYATCIA